MRRRRTLKREVAIAIMLVVLVMAVWTVAGADAELVRARGALVIGLAVPAFAYLAAAYGMDWISKQTNWGGRPDELAPPPFVDAEGEVP